VHLFLLGKSTRHPELGCYVWCPTYKQIVGCLIQTETLPDGERCQTMRTDQDAHIPSRFLGLRALCVLWSDARI